MLFSIVLFCVVAVFAASQLELDAQQLLVDIEDRLEAGIFDQALVRLSTETIVMLQQAAQESDVVARRTTFENLATRLDNDISDFIMKTYRPAGYPTPEQNERKLFGLTLSGDEDEEEIDYGYSADDEDQINEDQTDEDQVDELEAQ